MNPFIQQVLTKLAQLAVVWIAARLGQTLTSDQASQVVIEYLVPAAMGAWALYQAYRNRQKFATALASPKAISEHQAEVIVKGGGAPSVLTPKHEVPQ